MHKREREIECQRERERLSTEYMKGKRATKRQKCGAEGSKKRCKCTLKIGIEQTERVLRERRQERKGKG